MKAKRSALALTATIAAAAATLATAPAAAGQNTHGQLILHSQPNLQGSAYEDPAGHSAITRCEDAVTRMPEWPEPIWWYVLAAFPEGAAPHATGVTFGIEYDGTRLRVLDAGFADHDQVTRSLDWPQSGSAVLVQFGSIQTERLFEIGWFYGHQIDEKVPASFEASVNHEGAAQFLDGTVAEDIETFGALGFGMDGFILCDPVIFGACCVGEEGGCTSATVQDCASAGGAFSGLDTTCSAEVCDFGACCYGDDECSIVRRFECARDGHLFDSGNVDPGRCFESCCCPAVEGASWGAIKSRF